VGYFGFFRSKTHATEGVKEQNIHSRSELFALISSCRMAKKNDFLILEELQHSSGFLAIKSSVIFGWLSSCY
jgi:hypothetical protein